MSLRKESFIGDVKLLSPNLGLSFDPILSIDCEIELIAGSCGFIWKLSLRYSDTMLDAVSLFCKDKTELDKLLFSSVLLDMDTDDGDGLT